jgi:hypothetical protein
MIKARALILAFALAACGQSGEKAAPTPGTSAAPDPQTLNVEIGRYGVMLDHVRSLTSERPGSGETDPATPKELSRALRETVWQYNLERSELCARGLFTEISCLPVYDPVWISEPADAEPNLADIQSRSTALGEEVGRFWNAVCADARSRTEDAQEKQYVCAIE